MSGDRSRGGASAAGSRTAPPAGSAPGASAMIALVRNRGDDGGLPIAPAVAGDAGMLADHRTGAVGGDQQPGCHCAAVRQLDSTTRDEPRGKASRLPAADGDGRLPRRAERARPPQPGGARLPSSSAFLASAASSGPFSIMSANGWPGSTSPSKERKTGRTMSSRRLSVTTMSVIGCASISSHTPMVSNSRRAAATMADARGSRPAGRWRGIDHHNRKRSTQALTQGDRQCEPGKACPTDQDIDTLDAAS